ncbi:unnamed protein product [Anisakis simplex]|uniref:LSM14 domain-containing protein n=1 Tax=Anisakis simplex TaxID=6269 RepID=A0A0M3J0Y0_ANISI|nr:unnamed protein product [Anisakis simplex]
MIFRFQKKRQIKHMKDGQREGSRGSSDLSETDTSGSQSPQKGTSPKPSRSVPKERGVFVGKYDLKHQTLVNGNEADAFGADRKTADKGIPIKVYFTPV